jgi:hypothetical protein
MMGQAPSKRTCDSSEQEPMMDLVINLTVPKPSTQVSSREKFNKEAESWTFTQSSSKKRPRSSAIISHQSIHPARKESSIEQRDDSGYSDDSSSSSKNTLTKERTPINQLKYTAVDVVTINEDGTSTNKQVTTTNPYILCPSCCHSHQPTSKSKIDHRILQFMMNQDFSPPNPKLKYSQLTGWESYLRNSFRWKEDEKNTIQAYNLMDRKCQALCWYGLDSPENEEAIEDEEGEWGINTVYLGSKIVQEATLIWEFGRVPRKRGEFERCRERYIQVTMAEDKRKIGESKRGTELRRAGRSGGDERKLERSLREKAERRWEVDWKYSMKLAGIKTEVDGMGIWEGFDGVGVAAERDEVGDKTEEEVSEDTDDFEESEDSDYSDEDSEEE